TSAVSASATATSTSGTRSRPTRCGRSRGADPRGRGPGQAAVYVGALTLDVLLGDVRSLKQKRSAVAAIIAEGRRRQPGWPVAEPGRVARYRRTEIGVAVVSSTAAHAAEVLEACERLVAGRPEIELLSARQRLVSEED